MKNFKITMIAAAFVALVSGFTSCERDPYDRPSDNTGTSGFYRLTSVNVPTASDLNADGTANANLVAESACYADAYLRLNDDLTYRLEYKYALAAGGVLQCQVSTTAGTWSVNEGVLTLETATGNPVIYSYDGSGTISRLMPSTVYPAIGGTGTIVPMSGDVTLTFTRATE